MGRFARTLLVVGVLGAAFGQAAVGGQDKQEAIKKDRMRYAGTWRVVALEVNGNKTPDTDAQKITVRNRADGTWVIEAEGKEVGKGTSQIDPTKNPKTIDFTPSDGTDQGKTSRGIYEIKGDTRRLCYAAPGADRPTAFSSRPGSGHTLVVFRREKK